MRQRSVSKRGHVYGRCQFLRMPLRCRIHRSSLRDWWVLLLSLTYLHGISMRGMWVLLLSPTYLHGISLLGGWVLILSLTYLHGRPIHCEAVERFYYHSPRCTVFHCEVDECFYYHSSTCTVFYCEADECLYYHSPTSIVFHCEAGACCYYHSPTCILFHCEAGECLYYITHPLARYFVKNVNLPDRLLEWLTCYKFQKWQKCSYAHTSDCSRCHSIVSEPKWLYRICRNLLI